jgi:hypothetical protein
MSIANKWLLGFMIFFTLVLFVVAMMVLNMQSKWMATVDKLEQQQVQLDDRHDVLLRGTPQEPGIVEMRHEVAMFLTGRGRAWYNVMPQQVNAETGEMRVGELPTPNGIDEDLVVFVFRQKVVAEDDSEQAGAYLGQFRATAIADAQVVLVPVTKLLPQQLEQLATSEGPWAMYDLMPQDRHDIFADMDEERLRANLPEQSVDDYLRHGKPGDPNTDAADRLDEEGNYVRVLRDYAGAFAEMHRRHVVQTDFVASAREDLASVEKAIALSRVQEEFMGATITSLTAELAEARRQLDAVVAHKSDVEARLAAVGAKIDQIQAENQQLASRWIESQLEELARIEQAAQTAATTPQAATPVPAP